MDKVLRHLKLWQIVMVAGIGFLALGLTGEVPFTDSPLRAGYGQRAICIGGTLMLMAIVIYYNPRK